MITINKKEKDGNKLVELIKIIIIIIMRWEDRQTKREREREMVRVLQKKATV